MWPWFSLLAVFFFAACGGSAGPTGPDAGSRNDGGRPHVDAELPPDGGPPAPDLREVLERGRPSLERGTRETYAGIRLRAQDGRRYVLEVLRRSDYSATRRLVARDSGGRVLFSIDEAPGEQMMDFAVHPSGEVTVSVERTAVERGGYDLLRLSADGSVLHREPIPLGETLPEGDLGGMLPRPPWRMRARPSHALTDGWARLEARGEDVVTGFLSLAEEPSSVLSNRLVSGAMFLRWTGARWEERWARLVDPPHFVEPPLWTYDELRWGEVLVRPLLAVDEDGSVVVGRTWTQGRCRAVHAVFGEPSIEDCFGEDVAPNTESRILPFAFTVFSAEGEREATRTYRPSRGYYYGVFAMAARRGEVALGGATSRMEEDGTVALYPARPGDEPVMVPFDGLVAVLDRTTGRSRLEIAIDGGRGDYVAAMRWTNQGLLVGGAADWDRWSGGMSVSRGADPLVALVSTDDGSMTARTFVVEGTDRHHHLLAIEATDEGIVAVGPTDAPMTHSGDGGHVERMTFGGLTLAIAPP